MFGVSVVNGTQYGPFGNLEPASTRLAGTFRFDAPTFEDAAPVPEPASLVLLGTGLVGVAVRGRRKRAGQTRSQERPRRLVSVEAVNPCLDSWPNLTVAVRSE